MTSSPVGLQRTNSRRPLGVFLDDQDGRGVFFAVIDWITSREERPGRAVVVAFEQIATYFLPNQFTYFLV